MSATDTATGRTHRFGAVVGTGLLATVAAVVATTLGAALARAVGIDLAVQGGDVVPVAGIGAVTGVCSLLGVGLAVVLLRWSAHAAERFVQVTATLTVLSLVPPVLWGSDAATAATLVLLHLVAAAVVVPTLARRLRRA